MKTLVLGGGVIGLTLAWRLRQRGVDVTLVDRGVPGQEASAAAGGILGPQLECEGPGPFLDFCLRSRALYPKFVEELEALTGIVVGYRESGILKLAFTEAETHELAATAAWQRAFHLRAELLEPSELQALCPAASREAIAGLWLPDDHQVEPRLLVRALHAACEKSEVDFVTAEVESLVREDGRVLGANTPRGPLFADVTVVALGAWAGRIGQADLVLPVTPVRGQIVELQAAPGQLAHQLNGQGVYLVPRDDGRVLIGSTTEHVGFEKGTTPDGIQSLLDRAHRLCPSLRDASRLRQWSGLRPASADHLPLLSGTSLTGLVVASGHFRNGILLAPITGRTMADVVLGDRPQVDLTPFAPERFSLGASRG